ncbi:MAG: hypothetical protein SLAVMIC_00321 [uncultured marine phage]|uniref:Uncharacterized protein n=1 Tax=uncultured marine phage TaxID=707152 RepID=A0A8D9CEZ3_9VIRU|nr:MAG: hypothetical protein SLAVMIC_00321 [uncultured marine phage]
MSHKHQLNLKQALKFLFAGNSTFTVKSRATKKRYTFKVKSPKKVTGDKKPYFVSYMNGSDNNTSFQFFGTIFSGEQITYSFSSRKARISKDSVVNKTFEWLLRQLLSNNLENFELIEFWHEGKCGRCNRKLTDPKSIELGFGPFCRKPKTEAELKQEFRENRLATLLD